VNYALSPGNPAVFPWLAEMASCFQRARVHKLSFEYRTEISTSTPGVVMLSYILDVSEQPRVTKASIMQIEGTMSGPVWQNMVCPVKPDGRELMVSYGTGFPSGTDPFKYTFGQLQVSTVSANATVGEIWIDYTIELYNPSVEFVPGVMWACQGNNVAYGAFGPTSLVPNVPGTKSGYSGSLNLVPANGPLVASSTTLANIQPGGTITGVFPPGYFLVLWQGNGSFESYPPSGETFSISMVSNNPAGQAPIVGSSSFGPNGPSSTGFYSQFVIFQAFQVLKSDSYTINLNVDTISESGTYYNLLTNNTYNYVFVLPYDGNAFPT